MVRPGHLQTLACALVLFLTAGAATASAAPAGQVQFFRSAESDFDRYTMNPSVFSQQWMAARYARMRTYTPYFDERTAWYPNSWAYQDSYAIYRAGDDPGTDQYVLRDIHGRRLYIPFGCEGGTCPQYAADISHPGWRALYIARARKVLASGTYRGIFIDDVNMDMKVSDGNGNLVAPMDRATGRPMTEAAWQRYMADFMAQVRNELAGFELVHNQVWFFAGGQTNPQVRRATEAADVLEVERGFNDTNIDADAFSRLLGWTDYAHRRGKSLVFDFQVPPSEAERRYALATYLLVNCGHDFVGPSHADPGTLPDSWWAPWQTDLGHAYGARYEWQGVLRRDFAGGAVLVNPPGGRTVTVDLGSTMRTLDGNHDRSLTVRPRQGVTLLGAPPSPRRAASHCSAPPKPSCPAVASASARSRGAKVAARQLGRARRGYARVKLAGKARRMVTLRLARHGARGYKHRRSVRVKVRRGRYATTVRLTPGCWKVTGKAGSKRLRPRAVSVTR